MLKLLSLARSRGLILNRALSAKALNPLIHSDDPEIYKIMQDALVIKDDFVNEQEEDCLIKEIEPYMKRLHYEFDHWDDVSKIRVEVKHKINPFIKRNFKIFFLKLNLFKKKLSK